MINLTTISDSNYLIKGLTLYESIKEKTENFVLHYLCIDEQSFEKLSKFESETLKVYNCKKLLEDDKILNSLKINNYRYFCWSLASYFTNWLMKKNNYPICYIDSDILFHKDVNLLYQNFINFDVGIFRHRQFSLEKNYAEGWFNVGVVYFNNTEKGKFILNWWADAVQNKKYPYLATCGDQRYLDEFPKLTDNIFIDGEIGHGAPWIWQLYDFSLFKTNEEIIWDNKKQKLYFSHFSQFDYDLEKNSYIPSKQHHIYTPLESYEEIEGLKLIYDEYFNKIKITHKKYDR
jgi:hypothetical protein